VEIGCGANAYWASCTCTSMKQEGINVIAYDMHVETGGKIKHKDAASTKHQQTSSIIRKGGPSISKQHGDRTLFLCYPDEKGEGMGAECLENFLGTHVIHVGETFLDSNFASDQAPYGRSSSSEFQQRLASEFHCLLKVELPNWLHVRDSLSVWKRSQTSTIVFAADSDDDEEEDEEIEYRHIPCHERLPMNVAAPCCTHLLPQTTVTSPESSFKQKQKSRSRSNSGDSLSSKYKVKANKRATEGEDAVGSAARPRSDSTDSVRKKKRDRSNSTDSARKEKRERSDSTDSERKRKRDTKGQESSLPAGRERSNSTDSAKMRKKLKKAHEQSVDSLFGGGFGEDDDDQPSPSGRHSYGEYVTPW
jgi:hypothetical protein